MKIEIIYLDKTGETFIIKNWQLDQNFIVLEIANSKDEVIEVDGINLNNVFRFYIKKR